MSGEAGNMPAAESSSAYEGVGNSLKVVRERQGLSLPDVASRTRIRRQHLAAIEAGHFAELPGPVYITGFLRTYAETLGLDPETVVSRFQEESDLARQRQDLVFPMPRPEARSPRWWLVLVALAAAVVVYLVWYHYQEAFRRGAELVKAVPSRLAELVPPPTPIAAAPPRTTPPAAPGATPAPNASAPSAATAAIPATIANGAPAAASIPPASNTAPASASGPVVAAATPPAHAPQNQAPQNQAPQNPGSVGPAPVSAAAAATPNPRPAAAGLPPPLTLGPAPVPGSPVSGSSAPSNPPAAAQASGPQASAPPAAQATATPAATAPASTQVAAAPVNPPPANSPPANPAATLGPATQHQTHAGTRFGSTDPARLLVRADATSWVQVRGPNNEPIFTRLMGAGETYAVPAREGLTLATGNAGGISLLLDGTALPRLGDTGEVKRGLPLDPAGIKASLKVE